MIYTILSITGIIVSLFSNILNPNTETIQGLIVCIGLLPICLVIDVREMVHINKKYVLHATGETEKKE